MKIISVAHQKGGVGKTTVAINIASCYGKELKVGILDLDLQGSLTAVNEYLENITFFPYTENLDALLKLDLDLLIIDTPPYLTNKLLDIFLISDFVLIPMKVSFADIIAIKSTLELVKLAKSKKADFNFGILLNMVKPRTALNEEIRGLLNGYDVPIFTATLSERVGYIRSYVTSGVFNTDDEKAKEEVLLLADEILDKLNN